MDAEEKTEIEAKMQDVKDVLESEDVDDIKAKSEALMQASMKLGQAMYEAEQASAGEADGSDAGDASPDDAEVVDADFEEVDEKDKS